MKLIQTLVLFALTADFAMGQLTVEQKVADFQNIAGLYAKRYAPYEWKRDIFGFDLLNAAPWIDKILTTKDDLDFYEVLSEYVSKLNDAHDVYTLPANFQAILNFSVDIYDGKLLVDSINRTRLPATEFPFVTGYELVSIDGQSAESLLQTLLRYQVAANRRSTSRFAATLLTIRPQQLMPHAADVPDISTVVFRRPDSQLETYRIPWVKTGLPLVAVGKYITPAATPLVRLAAGDSLPDEIPAYMAPLTRLQNCRVPDRTVLGFGALTPIFAQSLPPSFVRRLGSTGDPFFSGVFEAHGFRIGFIRIPSYAPTNTTAALTAFQNEMAYFQANTDGLVIDEMRNPGGSLSYVNQLLSLVMPVPWRAMGFEIRATSDWVVQISSALEQAKAARAPQNIIDLLEMIKGAIVNANASFRGRTEPVPLDNTTLDRSPLTDSQGNLLAYTKPLIVLVDEMSASGAEVFAAGIQDNARGRLVGWRTMGAGGSVETWEAGSYSLGFTSVTESLMNRGRNVVTGRRLKASFPPAPYVENIGVRPDVRINFMTSDNLSQSGKPFVDAFVTAIVNQILNRPLEQ
jgi:peptidase S41-like protein